MWAKPGWAAIAVLLLAGLGPPALLVAAPGAERGARTRIERDIRYTSSAGAGLFLDAYLPAGAGRHPAIVFVHGGGWRAGDKASFAPGEQAFTATALRLTRLGFAVFSIDYRLGPAGRYPAAVDDVSTAVNWLRRRATRFAVDPDRVALFGASAGGNLAALAATRDSGAPDRAPRLRAIVSWSGPMDLILFDAELGGPSRHPYVEDYLGCPVAACPARYRAASPANHVDRGDPPMLLANGSSEIVPLAQAKEMAGRLATAGVPHRLLVIPGSRHAAQYEAAVWPATITFLKRYLR